MANGVPTKAVVQRIQGPEHGLGLSPGSPASPGCAWRPSVGCGFPCPAVRLPEGLPAGNPAAATEQPGPAQSLASRLESPESPVLAGVGVGVMGGGGRWRARTAAGD